MLLHDHGPDFKGCSAERHTLLVRKHLRDRRFVGKELRGDAAAGSLYWALYCLCCGEEFAPPYELAPSYMAL